MNTTLVIITVLLGGTVSMYFYNLSKKVEELENRLDTLVYVIEKAIKMNNQDKK